MKPTSRVLICTSLLISLLGALVFGQQIETKSESKQNISSADAAEESRLSASLIELYKLGKLDQALPVGKRLLELREKIFGTDSPPVAIALSNLAEIYRARNENDEAQSLYRRSLAILERNPESNPELLSNVLERLADIAFTKRDYQNSAGFLVRALAAKEVTVGKDDPALISLLHHLGNVYQVLRYFDQVEPLYLRALTIAEQRLGKKDSKTITMMKDFACLDLREKQPRRSDGEREKDDSYDPNKDLKRRAQCWLFGFRDDCDVYEPEIQKIDQPLNGRAVSLPKPEYPANARMARAFGSVFVALRIDEGGNVIEAKTVCGGPPLLLDPALKAARGAKFTPTMVNGKPKQVEGVVTYNFVRL